MTTLAVAGAFFISALSLRVSMVTTLDALFGDGTYDADHRYAYDQHMLMIYAFLIVVAGVLAAVGGLGLVTATSLNVLDRRRELGVLRAVGERAPALASATALSPHPAAFRKQQGDDIWGRPPCPGARALDYTSMDSLSRESMTRKTSAERSCW